MLISLGNKNFLEKYTKNKLLFVTYEVVICF